MINIAEQETGGRLVHDHANVAADPDRPEILVLRLLNLVQAHARVSRVQLQVERSRLYRFLLIASEFGEAVGECVGDAKVHDVAF